MRYRSGERKSTSFYIAYPYEIHRNEDEEIRGKRTLPGKEKILINTGIKAETVIPKIKERMSNIVVKI